MTTANATGAVRLEDRTAGNRYQPDLWAEPPDLPGAETPAGEALAGIRRRTEDCVRCALCEGRSTVVRGTGPARARLMVVGERPGAAEDACGRPFSGPAGDLLERMLHAIGLDRNRVYLSNAVRCRPPEDREPEHRELVECRAYLLAEIGALRPDCVLAAGGSAAHVILGDDGEPIGRLRGRAFRAHGTVVVPTWNPAYLLRRPGAKGESWHDLRLVRAVLAEAARNREGNGR